ncbi:MAG: hypothetical protein WBE26_10565 [Phycisphaerae bacterium]
MSARTATQLFDESSSPAAPKISASESPRKSALVRFAGRHKWGVVTLRTRSHSAERLSFGPIWATTTLFLLLLILSACFMAVSVGCGRYSWTAWVSLLPLFIAIRLMRPRVAMLCGALWGLSFCLSLVFGTEAAGPRTFPSLALLTAVPAIYAYLGARLTQRIGFAPLFLALGWIGVEWALNPLGLRNGLLAGSQGDGLLIDLVGKFLGYGLVAFLVAFVNASLLSVFDIAAFRVAEQRPVVGSDPSVRWVWHFITAKRLFSRMHSCQPRAPPALAS